MGVSENINGNCDKKYWWDENLFKKETHRNVEKRQNNNIQIEFVLLNILIRV